jgi:prepilin-type N-terminal cleavage/methylation domain-containing protein
MKKNTQSGFSLIELLLVVTIIGIIAALGVPSFQRGIRAADNGAAFATLRTMSSVQVSFYSRNGRFARLDELNAAHNGALGNLSNGGKTLTRGRFVFEMTPLSPTDAELKDGYSITASGTNGVAGTPYVFRVNETGYIDQVLP